MATHENVDLLSVVVGVTNKVAEAVVDRFCNWKAAPAESFMVETHVPGANGAPAVGILGMKPDADAVGTGNVASSMVLPGCQTVVELGEAVSAGNPLRVGGNGGEVDGAAYHANASGDVIVAYALTDGAVGEKISIHFVGYHGVVA